MRLSAIVPNYNHGRSLARVIDALATQVPRPDEILIIDDASTDDSPALLPALAAQYPPVRVIRHPQNLGVVRTLNRGLAEARGQYVYLGAADDRVLPGLFAAGLALLEAHRGAAFACAECRLVDQAGHPRGIRPSVRPLPRAGYVPSSAVPRLLQRADNWAHTSTAVIRRDLMEAAGGLDPALGSFADGFLLRRLALRHGFCFAPRLVAEWTINPKGFYHSTVGNVESMLMLLDSSRQRFMRAPEFPPWYASLFERRLRYGAVRLALGLPTSGPGVIEAAAGGGAVDRAAIRTALAVPGRTGRALALAWVALRKRPVSVSALARTALARRFRLPQP